MKRVWCVFGVSPYYDGGSSLLSLHDSKEGAKKAAERERRKRTNRFDRIEIVQRGVSTQQKEQAT